jgi:hypothetical protein
MKESRLSEEQIIAILRENAAHRQLLPSVALMLL